MEVHAGAATRRARRRHRRGRSGIHAALTMLTITLLSLVIAATSGFFAWPSIRREHLRSDARVAWLAAAIDEAASPQHVSDGAPALEYAMDFRSEVGTTTLDGLAVDGSLRRRLITIVSGGSVVVAAV